MSERNDSELLADILEAAERILTYTAGSDYDGFLTDTKTQDAVIRNLEIIEPVAVAESTGAQASSLAVRRVQQKAATGTVALQSTSLRTKEYLAGQGRR